MAGYIGNSPSDSSVRIARQIYTTSGITSDFTFTSGYDSGYIDIYVNGERQTEGTNFTASDGSIPSASLNCSNSIFNKKPCFPEIVWDNLQSTTPVKALPIVDNIGSILGAWTKKKG